MKIDIIGSYPPPYGGISVSVKRLSEHLDRSGIKPTIYDTSALLNANITKKSEGNIITITSPIRWALKYLFRTNVDIVHLNAGSNWRLRLYIGIVIGFIRRKKLVISLNGNDLTWPYAINCIRKPDSSFLGRLVTKLVIFSIKKASFVIVLNADMERFCLSLGVKPDRLKLISPFFPPVIREEDIAEIHQNIWNFINCHTPIISANAFKIVIYNDQDLYGIDMCVDLCASLLSAYPQVGLVFCLPDIGNYEYFNELKQRIEAKKIENNFLFLTNTYQFYPILMKSDIFIRPTNTDGDALSLREALFFKVPSVASDIVPRPKGTILFKNRDFSDFVLKVTELLSNYEKHKEELDLVTTEDNLEKFIKVYHSQL